MIDLEGLVLKLKDKRKVFHSEDDLKFSLGYLIKKEIMGSEIRLEKPISLKFSTKINTKEKEFFRAPIDIVAITKEGKQIPIEIKYKTLSLVKDKKAKASGTYTVDKEEYDLANQGASDLGRFNFRKDIARIEQFVDDDKNNADCGFCLIITNDKDYWSEPSEKSLIKNFSLGRSSISKNDPEWNYTNNIDENKYEIKDKIWFNKVNKTKRHWTCEGDLFLNLELKNDYKIQWKVYSIIDKGGNAGEPVNAKFQYLLLKVQKSI